MESLESTQTLLNQDIQLMDFLGAFVRGKLEITAKEAYVRLEIIQNRRDLPGQIVRSSPKPLVSATNK